MKYFVICIVFSVPFKFFYIITRKGTEMLKNSLVFVWKCSCDCFLKCFSLGKYIKMMFFYFFKNYF